MTCLFEGFGVDIASNIIVHCIKAQYFTLEEINDIILTFPYSNIDRANKPQVLKVATLNLFKVRLTACEIWNFMRLLQLMISSLVPIADEKWHVFLNFSQIIERLCM